jgi:hypothetical protein
MGEQIVFEAKLKLKGTLAEIEGLTERVFGGMVAEVENLEIVYPKPFPGGWPILIHDILDRKMLVSLIEDMPRLKVIEGIDGGMRNPHLHLEGEIVLLDRARFKEVVGQVAVRLATKFAETAEYVEVVEAMHSLAGDSVMV